MECAPMMIEKGTAIEPEIRYMKRVKRLSEIDTKKKNAIVARAIYGLVEPERAVASAEA